MGPHDRAGDSAGLADEDRVVAGLWLEAESSSSATSRVAALRELRSFYAVQRKPEPAVPPGPRGISLAAVLELARECGIESAQPPGLTLDAVVACAREHDLVLRPRRDE